MPNSKTPLEDITQKVEQGLDDIEKLIPEDPIAKATGAKVGTDEHLQQGELLNKVKETNSTKRVNRILRILEWVGYVALAVSSIIKLTGIIYDIDFHVPHLKEVIGDIGVAILGFFIAIVIIIMTHITSDGLVNNKWKAIPKIVLVWLAIFGLTASFYFDYRAINNYTKVVVKKIKNKKIKDGTDITGVAIQGVDSGIKLLISNLKLYQSQIQTAEDRLKAIAKAKDSINQSIERVKAKKEKIRSRREIKKLNQNIYTSRKQLEGLSNEEASINAKQKEIMDEMASIQKQIENSTDKKGQILKNVDTQMDSDQFNRLVFLFVLVIFIEVASFGKLLADFLGNKNLENDLREQLDTLQNNTNVMSVLRGHLTAQEVRQAREFDKELTMRGAIADVHALSAISSMYRQGQNVKVLTSATHQIGEATNEVTQLAVEGIASNIRANLATKRIEKLQQILEDEAKDVSIKNEIVNKISIEPDRVKLEDECKRAGEELKKKISKFSLFSTVSKEEYAEYKSFIKQAVDSVAKKFPNEKYKDIWLKVIEYADIQPL